MCLQHRPDIKKAAQEWPARHDLRGCLGLCLGFSWERTMRKKRKNPRSLAALGFSLELLGRFELPTSSLPMTRSTDWAITASRNQLHYYSIIFPSVKGFFIFLARFLKPVGSAVSCAEMEIAIYIYKKRRSPAPAKLLSAFADVKFFVDEDEIVQIRDVLISLHCPRLLSVLL